MPADVSMLRWIPAIPFLTHLPGRLGGKGGGLQVDWAQEKGESPVQNKGKEEEETNLGFTPSITSRRKLVCVRCKT